MATVSINLLHISQSIKIHRMLTLLVDLLVSGPRSSSFDPIVNRLEAAGNLSSLLSSRAHISQNGNPTMNFAIPYPTDPAPPHSHSDTKENERYIQVDVHYLPTLSQFQWELFHSAHGDLWNMLGSTIRPFGLTVNDTGLFLRIEQIEAFDKTKAKVFLTSEPKAILDFLGLDEKTWWKGFESVEEMFNYAAGCRFFWVKPSQNGGQKRKLTELTAEGGEGEKEDLKRSDRKRVTQRPIFAQWMEDFIPRCRESGKFSASTSLTREQVRLEAFEKFGVRKEYEDKLREWNLTKHKDELWRITIKGSIPEVGVDPQVRGAAARVFKGIVMEGEVVEGMVVPESVKMQEDGYWDLDAVKAWVMASWEEAGKIGMEVLRLKSMEKQRKMESEKMGVAVKAK